jgi:hypothetical protein
MKYISNSYNIESDIESNNDSDNDNDSYNDKIINNSLYYWINRQIILLSKNILLKNLTLFFIIFIFYSFFILILFVPIIILIYIIKSIIFNILYFYNSNIMFDSFI